MRNFYFMLTVIAGLFLNTLYSQDEMDIPAKNKQEKLVLNPRIDNMGYWMKLAEKGIIPYNQPIPVKPAENKGSMLPKGNGMKAQDSPDVPVTSATNVTESENSIFIDPNDNQYVLNSNNSTSWTGSSVGTLYGANYFQSADGGTTWGGSASGAGGSNSGDPTTAINLSGRQFVNYIDNPGGQGIAYSDNGTSWSTATIAPNPGSLADKNHMWIDNSPSSPYVGNLYCFWTDFGGAYDSEVVFSRSTNNGLNWSTRVPVSGTISSFDHGVNCQTGPNGELYACWATYPNTGLTENGIGFVSSANGGTSFATPKKIISTIQGIRALETTKNMRVNSFPVMAVDISGGPNNGNIYVIWTNYGDPNNGNSGTNISVYMIRSTNGGSTWSSPTRVNQGPFSNGYEAYQPWISCDAETGTLSVVYYDDRDISAHPTTSCEAWVSYSFDAGNTWTAMRVSDVSFTPSPIPGLAGGYMGDYCAITSKGGRVYPCWTDNRGTTTMTYVSPFDLGLNAAFTANNTNICVGGDVTFTDQSSGFPTTWTWSFPGGTPNSYSGQNPPAITYNSPGSYDVSLTVGDGSSTKTETKTGYIVVENIIANFSGTPTTVVIGNTVTFTDNSACGPTSWSWSFPGGTPNAASGIGPHTITYNTIGAYNASLTVSNGTYNDTETKAAYINVIPANFNMTNGTITTCSGNFYDSGGPTGNYSDNENFTLTFYPSTPGAAIEVAFSAFSTEVGYDYLRIYNGTTTAAPLIGTYNGTAGPGTVMASNIDGALTFNFTSDFSVTSSGWAASINCVIPPNPGLWVGGTSTNWNVASNWNENTVPTASDYITIPSSALHWPTYSGNLEIGVQCGDITMEGPSELTVTGDLTISTGKSLTSNADATIFVGGDWNDNGTFNPGTGTVNFYSSVASDISLAGSAFGGGKFDNSGGGGYYGFSTFIEFDCFTSFDLISAKVYASGAGNRTFYWANSGGTVQQQVTINVPNGESRVTLNFNITPGSNHQLGVSGTPNLYRNNSGVSYPYPIGAVGSVTSSAAGTGYYYFYYDLEFSTGSGVETFNNLIISKVNSSVSSNSDIDINENFTINPNAWFTNAIGNTINVGGDMTLLGDNTGKGSFIDNGTFNVAGTTTVQSYYTDSRWHFISSPVSNAVSNIFLNIYLKEWDESTYTWNYIIPTTTPLVVGTGYEIWSTIGNPTINYTGGSLNSANISPVLSATDVNGGGIGDGEGWNLVGVPFPSAIDWGTTNNPVAGYVRTNLDNSIYIWNGTQYATYNPALNGGNGLGTNGGSQVIQSMQSFFVKANNTNPFLTIPNGARVHTSQANLKADGDIQMISLGVEGNGDSDEIYIEVNELSTEGFDSDFDAYKLWGYETSPQLYVITPGNDLSINVIPEIAFEDIINLGFKSGEENTYTITAQQIENFDDYSVVLLEDLLTNTIVNLLVEPVYTFVSSPDDAPERFRLRFTDEIIGLDDNYTQSVNIYGHANSIYVQVLSDNENYVLTIYDMLGQSLGRMDLVNDETNAFQIKSGSGFYLAEVRSGNNVVTKKILLK